MRRREFFAALATGGLLGPARRLLADSILVSSNPLISEYNLESVDDRYTPVDDFYVRNHYGIPPAAATLILKGEVQRPVTLTDRDLAALKVRQVGAVLECSGNGTGPDALVSNGLWEGWSLGEVLALARPTAQAKYLHLTGADGFRRSIPIDYVHEDAMLVTRLNRRPLGAEHGAPWRALFPGRYGMESVKWLREIELAVAPWPAQPADYLASLKAPDGTVTREPLPRVLTKSVITYPALGAVLHRGTVTLRGLAWSGSGRIVAVEVTTDGGKSWRLASLEPGSRYEWTIWRYTVHIQGTGIAEFACRAVDDTGAEQPATRDPRRIDPYANNTIERIQFLVQ